MTNTTRKILPPATSWPSLHCCVAVFLLSSHHLDLAKETCPSGDEHLHPWRKQSLQLVCYQLADEVAVGLACGERAAAAVVVEEFVGVREVEVSREEERVPEVARLMDERMAE